MLIFVLLLNNIIKRQSGYQMQAALQFNSSVKKIGAESTFTETLSAEKSFRYRRRRCRRRRRRRLFEPLPAFQPPSEKCQPMNNLFSIRLKALMGLLLVKGRYR